MNVKYQHILLLLPARLGDTLFYTPSIALLKHHHPYATIDVLALSSLSASVLFNNPHIGQVHVLPDDAMVQTFNERYNLVINLHHDVDTNRYLEKFQIETWCAPQPDLQKHQCAESIEFIAHHLGIATDLFSHRYMLYPKPEHFVSIEQQLQHDGVDLKKNKLIGLHLGCHGIAKRDWRFWRASKHRKVWPLKSFQRLAIRLQKYDPTIRFVLTGSKNEMLLGHQFCKKIAGTINLMDKTSIQSLSALMNYLAVFITSDTGALHVACATSVNLIALFGPTSLTRTGPFPPRQNHKIIQRDAMKSIRVEDVYQCVMKTI